MKEQERFEWIESYLLGELTESVEAEFESMIQSNPNFAQEVQFHEDLGIILQDKEALAFQQTVQEVIIDKDTQIPDTDKSGKVIPFGSKFVEQKERIF